jgi:hypothetical protein
VAEAPTLNHHHDAHDERLIASLLDRDASGSERSIAQARVASCPECAALHADLVALSRATTELPPVARTRDFRLTPADAARLSGAAAGEPRTANARLSGEMTVLPTDHATHDTLLIASLLDRTPGGPDRDRAEALLAGCDDCAALHRDLVALQAATRSLPTPTRPRDFTLAPGDVARLRPMGLRRFLALFGSSRDMFSRPLAVGLTTIGLAGLLVATVPGALFGQGTSAPALSAMEQSTGDSAANPGALDNAGAPLPSTAPSVTAAQLAPSAAPSAAPVPGAPYLETQPQPSTGYSAAGPVASKGATVVAPEASTAERQAASAPTGNPAIPAEGGGGPSSLIVVAGLLLIIGLGLFALRWAAHRVGAD